MSRTQWQFALVQHPMILLIHEDRGKPLVGERVAPWGAPDIQEYAQRVRRNLQAMDKYPDLKLNYEFSGIELQILAEQAPDVMPVIRQFVEQGRLAFLGGDYSQPHGQLYSGELNYRQLEHGLKIFKDLVGYTVTNNFHQETCLHDQMPQLLDSFGFTTACPPAFAHTITPLEGLGMPSFVWGDYRNFVPVGLDGMALWRGLDGTELPLLMPTASLCGGINPNTVFSEEHRGLWRSSDVLISAPDMAEIDPQQYAFLHSKGQLVLLDEAAQQHAREHQPTWKARLHSYWSYSEGEWAEAVYRQIRQTETMLLAEEAVAAACGAAARSDYDADWKTTLAAMHHDVHWIEVTDLKRQYIQRMDQVQQRSRQAIARLVGAQEKQATEAVRVVNPLACRRREVVRFTLPGRTAVRVVGEDGQRCPTQCIPTVDGQGLEVLFVAELASLGIRDYHLQADPGTLAQAQSCETAEVRAGAGTYVVARDGTVREVRVAGRNVLAGPGNDLHYLDEKGAMVGGVGRPGTMVRYAGAVGDVLRVTAPVGSVAATIEFVASPANAWMQMATTLEFHEHAIGVMWQDWTKLNCYWPVAGRQIRQDIPYGAVTGQKKVPLYAPNWLSVSGEAGGLAVLNAGTPKHFVEDGVIGCVWAWGGRTFSNRIHVEWAEKTQYDLRLDGRHTIRSAAMGLAPGADEAETAWQAACFNSPLLAFPVARGMALPKRCAVPDLAGTGLVATAVMHVSSPRGMGGLRVRFFEAAGKSHAASRISAALGRRVTMTDLKGNVLEEVPAYRIGYLILAEG